MIPTTRNRSLKNILNKIGFSIDPWGALKSISSPELCV